MELSKETLLFPRRLVLKRFLLFHSPSCTNATAVYTRTSVFPVRFYIGEIVNIVVYQSGSYSDSDMTLVVRKF